MKRSSALARIVRRVSVLRPAAAAARAGYAVAARALARALAQVPGVDSVYLLGSLTRPEFVKPGKSDVDLIVAARMPTLEAELELRDRLRRVHRRAHAIVPVFDNLDYFDVDELDHLRCFANGWALDLDRRWSCLAGTDRLSVPPARPAFERRVELCAMSLKRWMKASTRLLAPRPFDDRLLVQSLAERLLMDVLAGYLDTERLTLLDVLLARGAAAIPLPALARLARGASRAPELLLEAALEVLEQQARDVTSAFHDRWPVGESPPPLDVPAPLVTTARSFVDGGFAGFGLVRRSARPGDGVALAVAPPDWSAAEVLARTREANQRTAPVPPEVSDWLSRPVVLTAPLFRAAALLPPAPFVGAELETGPAYWHGQSFEAPPAPSPTDLEAIRRTRVTMLFIRRLVRTRWARQTWNSYFDYDVSVLAPALSRWRVEGSIPLDWSRADLEGEQALVAAHRRFIATEKFALAPVLTERLGSPRT
jgi:predicted nucleotidyltransferase